MAGQTNITYKIAIGGASLGPSDGALARLESEASLSAPVNSCLITLAPSATISARAGDAVKVSLGYDQELSQVFAGKVTAVRANLHGLVVEARSSFAALVGARYNLLYEQQSAGDIASNLLKRLKLAQATVESGPTFPSYALSDRGSVWAHLRELAGLCGFLLYADHEDKAVFKAYKPATTHSFAYGVDILDYAEQEPPPVVDGVEVYGESPAGQGQSDDASAWLTTKLVKGTAGKSAGAVVAVRSALARNQRLAGDLAGNLLRTLQIAGRGTLRLPGAPLVRLADAVLL